MNDALKMQISAFVDGELPENESELLLRRLSQDVALRNQADAYLRIGRLVRREREIPQMGQLRKRIAASLGEQPMEVAATQPEPSNRYVKPAAGLAIAASVAILALVGLRQAEIPGSLESAATSVAATPSPASPAGYTEPLPEDVASRPVDMLTQYYLSHGATSADLGANGILTRLVTLELREGKLSDDAPATDAPEASPASPEDDERPNGN